MALTTEQLVELASEHAVAARERAYAPYSNFLMGAAAVTADGAIVEGVLIENVSLGLAMCAERVALFAAVTSQQAPVMLALCSKRTEEELTFPCGACLQVALEVVGTELIIVAVDPNRNSAQTTLGDLLPQGPKRFTPDY